MKTTLKLALLATLALGLVVLGACSDDDDNNNGGGTNPPVPEAWEGEWLSVDTDIAPLLAADPFNYDTVRVTMNANNTVVLETHVTGGAWTTQNGVYTVTEEATGTVHSIAINYTAFEQEGIIEIVPGTPDYMWLEVVQTVPAIPVAPRTPADGFGSDPALGVINIQKYARQD
jgi:hypothetical protein